MKRKLISIGLILSVLLSALSVITIPASAADATAKLDLYDGETLVGSYTNVQKALDAVTKDGMTLKQTADIWARKDLVLWFKTCAYDITFDGNGFKMNYYPDKTVGFGLFEIGSGITGDILFRNLQVTLTDDTNTGSECYFGETSAAGTITFDDCTYHGFRGALLVKSGTVNLNNCNFSVDFGSVIRTENDKATVNIHSGTYTATPDISTSYYAGTCHINRGTLNVYGGSIVGIGGEAIHTVRNNQPAYAPVLNLFGGYITSDASTGTMSSAFGKSTWNIYGGTVVNTGTGYALYPQDAQSVNVWNGNFHVQETTAFCFFGAASAPSYIYGGIFTGGKKAYRVLSPADRKEDYSYPANTKTIAYGNCYNPIMTVGAQVRLSEDGTNGIRFTSTIKKGNQSAYQNITALIDEGTTLSYGTLIAPKDSVTPGEFTSDALKTAGKLCLDIPAKSGITETDEQITLRAAMIGIRDGNKAREFAAVSYIKATIQGAEVFFYSCYTPEDNARSIRGIATAALNDLQAVQSDEYAYAVTVEGETMYSPYSPALRAILEGYLA